MRIIALCDQIITSVLKCVAWLLALAALVVLIMLVLYGLAGRAEAAEVPSDCVRYQRDVMRAAHAELGLNAPIAVFSAQLYQESSCNPQAVSTVGAQGLGQFMPATSKWWCDLNGLSAAECQPSSPVWSIQALIGYDHWLYDRVKGESEFDRWWAALRAYNGGLGHWQKEAATVRPALDRQTVDAACGKARRNVSFCPENLGYPRRILLVLQARFLSWGSGVSA
jgi:hypothetical protein